MYRRPPSFRKKSQFIVKGGGCLYTGQGRFRPEVESLNLLCTTNRTEKVSLSYTLH